jgi:uncharacterized protein YcbK (DUF882 family)
MIKKFNIHKIFVNIKAAQIFLLMNAPRSMRELSKLYRSRTILLLERKNPSKSLIKLQKEMDKIKKISGYRENETNEVKNSQNELKNLSDDEKRREIDRLYLDLHRKIHKLVKERAKKIIKNLYKSSRPNEDEMSIIYSNAYRSLIKELGKSSYFMHPTVNKYCNIFKELGWVKIEKVKETHTRTSKKGKKHIYPYTGEKMRIYLPKVIIDYLTEIRGITLTQTEKEVIEIIFSMPPVSEFLINEGTRFDKDVFPIASINIAEFVERTLFRFLYIATTPGTFVKIEEITDDTPPSVSFPILFKITTVLFPRLVEKILNKGLSNHLLEVIRDNLWKYKEKLLLPTF